VFVCLVFFSACWGYRWSFVLLFLNIPQYNGGDSNALKKNLVEVFEALSYYFFFFLLFLLGVLVTINGVGVVFVFFLLLQMCKWETCFSFHQRMREHIKSLLGKGISFVRSVSRNSELLLSYHSMYISIFESFIIIFFTILSVYGSRKTKGLFSVVYGCVVSILFFSFIILCFLLV